MNQDGSSDPRRPMTSSDVAVRAQCREAFFACDKRLKYTISMLNPPTHAAMAAQMLEAGVSVVERSPPSGGDGASAP